MCSRLAQPVSKLSRPLAAPSKNTARPSVMLAEEMRELRAVIRRWAETEVAPHAASVDAESRFPDEAWQSYVKNGFVGMQYPAEYGGEGGDALASAILIEEMARVCASSSLMALISKLA